MAKRSKWEKRFNTGAAALHFMKEGVELAQAATKPRKPAGLVTPPPEPSRSEVTYPLP